MLRIGRFEIVEKLGDGGMGVVYKARDPDLDRLVAIKCLSVESDDALGRFYREARAAGRLQHDNIVKVFEFDQDEEGSPYIVMEYLGGPSLKQCMLGSGELDVDGKLRLLVEVLDALDHAHAHGVYHRDIKPGNIVLTEDGHAKLLDFGVAKLADSDVTRTRVVLGTLPYMSPEQVKGEKMDGRTDIFSLGVVLYELLGGRRPFDADDTWETMKRIACEPTPPLGRLGLRREHMLHEIVDRALEKEVDDRYATASEMATALNTYREVLKRPLDAASDQPDVRELFERGKRFYERGGYWRAMSAFRQVLELMPDHEPSRRNMRLCEQAWRGAHARELERIGLLLWKRKEYQIAVKTFDELIQLQPDNEYARWLTVLARRHMACSDERQDMLQLFERAMSGDEQSPGGVH